MPYVRASGPFYSRKGIPSKKMQTIVEFCKFKEDNKEIIFLLDTEHKKRFVIFTKRGIYNNTTHTMKLFLFVPYRVLIAPLASGQDDSPNMFRSRHYPIDIGGACVNGPFSGLSRSDFRKFLYGLRRALQNGIEVEERLVFWPRVEPATCTAIVPHEGSIDASNEEMVLSEDTFYRVLMELAPVSMLEVGSSISQKKQKNARKFFAMPAEETIYAMLDVTVFSSGKKGFAIASKGIYCRNPTWCNLPGSYFLPWAALAPPLPRGFGKILSTSELCLGNRKGLYCLYDTTAEGMKVVLLALHTVLFRSTILLNLLKKEKAKA